MSLFYTKNQRIQNLEQRIKNYEEMVQYYERIIQNFEQISHLKELREAYFIGIIAALMAKKE